MTALKRALFIATAAGEHGRCEPEGGHHERSAREMLLPAEVGFPSATPGAKSAQSPGTPPIQEKVMLTHKQKIDIARERFGQPFVHEPGSKWKPNSAPFLTRWLQSRGKA